jgi:hypothetical protein
MYFQHSQARTPIGLVARHIHAINNSWSGKRSQSRNSHSDVACAACAFNNICTYAADQHQQLRPRYPPRHDVAVVLRKQEVKQPGCREKYREE